MIFLLSLIFTVLVLPMLPISLIRFLKTILKRDQFPYRNSSMSMTIPITFMVFCSSIMLIIGFYTEYYTIDVVYLFNDLILPLIIYICLFIRILVYIPLVNYYATFLKEDMFEDDFITLKKHFSLLDSYNRKRNWTRFLLIIVPSLLLLIGIILAVSIDQYSMCSTFTLSWSQFNITDLKKCNKLLGLQVITVLKLSKILFVSFMNSLLVFLLYFLCRNKLNNDIIYIRFEIFYLSIFFIISNMLLEVNHIFLNYRYEQITALYATFTILRNFFLIVILEVTHYKKLENNSHIFKEQLTDFDKFMRNKLCFTWFQKNINSNDEIYLSYWVKMYMFHKRLSFMSDEDFVKSCKSIVISYVKGLKIAINEFEENEVRALSKLSVNDSYFDNESISTKKIVNTLDSAINYINFPEDIRKKIKEEYYNGFKNMDKTLFLSSFKYVYNYLFEVYNNLIEQEKTKSLTKLAYYFDFITFHRDNYVMEKGGTYIREDMFECFIL